jgi:hypothetical protein
MTTTIRDKLIADAISAGKVPDHPEQRSYLRGRHDAAPAETEKLLREAAPRFSKLNATIAEQRRSASRAAPADDAGTGLFPQLAERDRPETVAAAEGTGLLPQLAVAAAEGTGWF